MLFWRLTPFSIGSITDFEKVNVSCITPFPIASVYGCLFLAKLSCKTFFTEQNINENVNIYINIYIYI